MFPALWNAWIPMLVICTFMFTYLYSIIFVESLNNHTNRLRFFNAYCFLQVVYNFWYAFVIFNDFWIAAPFIMCRDTKNNPPPMNTPAFDDCMGVIESHTTVDLCVNTVLGIYLGYIIKQWANKLREDDYDGEVENVESEQTCCACFSINTGVKVIAGFVLIHTAIVLAIVLNHNVEVRALLTPLFFLDTCTTIILILGLSIKDNDTLRGRWVMFTFYVVCSIIFCRAIQYYTTFDSSLFSSTMPKALCKGDTDPNCITNKEQLELFDNLLALVIQIYCASALYRYYKLKQPADEERIALTAVNVGKE